MYPSPITRKGAKYILIPVAKEFVLLVGLTKRKAFANLTYEFDCYPLLTLNIYKV